MTTWYNLNQYAGEAYQTALMHYNAGRSDSALEWLTRAVLFSPQDPSILSAYGKLLAQNGRIREAEHVLASSNEIESCAENLQALQTLRKLTDEIALKSADDANPSLCFPALTCGLDNTSNKPLSESWMTCFSIENGESFCNHSQVLTISNTSNASWCSWFLLGLGTDGSKVGDDAFERSAQETQESAEYIGPDIYVILLSTEIAAIEALGKLRFCSMQWSTCASDAETDAPNC